MRAAAAAALVTGAVVAGACSSEAAAVCSPLERAVEPGSPIHVLDGVDATFDLSPPTSGPHQLPAPDGGVSDAAIPEARQVSALEAGRVILQYSPALSDADIAALEALASPDVVVAPAASTLDDDAVVAFSAWSHRQLCDGLDLDAASSFIDDRVGAYFAEHDGG